jgi:acetyltransferase-like isoleucine patch superfamily enzyme
MRGVARVVRNLWHDWRMLRWLVRLRLELRRNGGRLRVEGWRGVRMLQQPRIRTNPLGHGGGVTTIRFSRGAMIGYGVILEIYARGDNLLELRRASRIYEGARIELRGGTIKVGERCMIHDEVILKSDGYLSLGHDVRVSYGSVLHCSERVELGAYTGLAEYVSITDSDHTIDGSDVPIDHRPIVTDPVLLERNVFVARASAVLKGVRVGRNSVIGANSLVRHGDYPPRSLLVGTPAKLIRELEVPDRVRELAIDSEPTPR